ncbi:OsmC family protein [Streptomyces virginiae]
MVDVRGHRLRVDQPTDAGGADTAPTPTELFAASLATCVAFYAGRCLLRHGMPCDGLGVRAEFVMATDRPARVTAVRMVIVPPPQLPEERRAGLLAVASHCTVHNTLQRSPDIGIALAP